jgi:heme/copper-type cytochrome/quinol oxidase subunit 1
VSFGIWVHHMFTVGIPHLALAFFSAGTAIIAVPTSVQIFAWLATLAHGRPRWDVPMLYVFGFFFVFVLGGLTGVMVAMVPFDWQAHESYFVVAHMHYVVAGAFAFPMLAALYYWLPLLTGRTAVHRMSVPAFWLVFVGFNLTFFMMHLTGLLGMPRRVYTYPGHEGWIWLNLLSSVGGFIMTIGFGIVVIDLLARSLEGGDAGMGHADSAGALCFRLNSAYWDPRRPHRPRRARAVAGARRRLSRLRAQRLAGDTGRSYDIRRARAADCVVAPELPAALHGARHRGSGPGDAVSVLPAGARRRAGNC